MEVAGEAIEFDHGSRILRIRTNALRVNNANRSRKNWGPSCLSIGLAGVNCTSAQTGCCCSCFFCCCSHIHSSPKHQSVVTGQSAITLN